jgi:iron-sulfur cluster repair protein YtfE (RIC family)
LEHLEHEHREVERMLTELQASEEGDEREQLILDLEEALRLHMAVEEQYLYPIVAEVMDAEHVTEAQVEHDLARDGIAKLKALSAEPGFGAAVEMLQAGIAHHVQEEEDEVFAELREQAGERIARMDPEQLEEQAEPIDDLEVPLPGLDVPVEGPVGAGADGSAGGGAGGEIVDLDGLTRDELYERAKEADVPGRSSMTKEQLADALRP